MPPRETEAAFFALFTNKSTVFYPNSHGMLSPKNAKKAPGISRGQFHEFYSAFSLQWAA